jgi:hypothetical protein
VGHTHIGPGGVGYKAEMTGKEFKGLKRTGSKQRQIFTESPVGKNFLRIKAKMSALCVEAKFSGGSKENIKLKGKQ